MRREGMGVPDEGEIKVTTDSAKTEKPEISTVQEEPIKKEKVQDPEDLSEEAIKAARKLIQGDAEANYTRYFEDRKLLMETKKDSHELRERFNKLKNQITLTEEELSRTKSAYEHAGKWSFRHKRKLLKERRELEDKNEELKHQADKSKLLIPRVAEAENFVRRHNELELKAEMTKAKFEAEKH